MLILGQDKGKLLNALSQRPEYYEHLKGLRTLLSYSRLNLNNGKKLLYLQSQLYEIIMSFEKSINESSNDEVTFMYKQLRVIAKSIVDGILWRETGYNRVYIGMLSYAKGPGYLKDDISTTLKKIENKYLRNNIIIINDLSNFSRVGDYLIIKDEKIVDILEVKGKKIRGINYYDKAKTGKQSGKMVETFNQLHTYPNKEIFIKTSYLQNLQSNIKRAYLNGYSLEKLNKFTFIRVIYNRNFKDADLLIKKTKKLQKVIKEELDDKLIILSNYDFYHTKHNRYATSVITPYSIFPLDDQSCIYLMAGVLQVVTYINISGIKREFEKQGWTIEETKSKTKENKTSDEDINASNIFYENNVDMSLFKIRKKDGYHSIFSLNELQFIALEYKSYKDIIESHNLQYEEAKKDRTNRKFMITIASDKEVFL